MARQRCAKRVFESRDFTGHYCLHQPVEGSKFCRVHQPPSEQEDPSRDTDVVPTVNSTQRTTYHATLEWRPGQGPVVKAPYRGGYGFITKVVGKATDDGPVSVEVRGVMRKADGTPGAQRWESTFNGERLVPAQWMTELEARMDEERSR